VDYLTDEQRSYGDKAPLELGADLQFGPLEGLNRPKTGNGSPCEGAISVFMMLQVKNLF
jgi:hypothetical protein